MKNEITPLGGRVVLKKLKKEDNKLGNIILPEIHNKKHDEAIVISVGHSCPLSQGDTVIIDKYSGQEIMLNNEEYIIIKLDDILAVMSK